MAASFTRLTTTEAAFAADVTVAQVNRIVDEKILPAALYSASGKRTFLAEASIPIAFYFKTAEHLTAPARLLAIQHARTRCRNWEEWRECRVQEGPITVSFTEVLDRVEQRMEEMKQARAAVSEDPEILSGTPVVKGTRVPVYDVAAAVQAGKPTTEIQHHYPALTARQIELAAIYAKVTPPRGRPVSRWLRPRAARTAAVRRLPAR